MFQADAAPPAAPRSAAVPTKSAPSPVAAAEKKVEKKEAVESTGSDINPRSIALPGAVADS